MTHPVWSLLILSLSLGVCAPDQPAARQAAQTRPADSLRAPRYDFENPSAAFNLPSALKEISGLTMLDAQHLGAVEDEKGVLYILDVNTGKIIGNKGFGKKGDYEGVARMGEGVAVLRSDGRVWKIKDWKQHPLEADDKGTPLKARHDTEGIVYDAARNRLLIACKEYAGKGMKKKKAIYAYDFETDTMSEDPVFVVDTKDLPRSEDPLNAAIRSFFETFGDLSGFKPSGLALHPATGQLYILSSVRKVIVVMNPDGQMAGIWPLNADLLPQPEGLAFLSNGDLFISSEGGGNRKGRLLRFNQQ